MKNLNHKHLLLFAAGLLPFLPVGNPVLQAQTNLQAAVSSRSANEKVLLDTEPPPPPIVPAVVLKEFLQTEQRTREELNQHTFKREVLLQTIGPNGEVTGEYIRHSQFLFDDKGNRIERVLYHPPSTIREMRITKEDIQDLAGAQLLGIDATEAQKYSLVYAGPETIDGRQLLAIDIRPAQQPNPHRMRNRYFVGRVWVDPASFQLVKVRGLVEPQGKQRFPVFETWRASTAGLFNFPVRTSADDVLHFPGKDVHYRISVRYYDYKRFSSAVQITELDEATND